MSLMVQPAPLMRTAPRPNSANIPASGRWPGTAARPILHVQGRNSSHVPVKYKVRIGFVKEIMYHV